MPKSFERWASESVNNVARELNLHGWRITVVFDNDEDEECTAWTCVDSRYLNSWIHFTPTAKKMWRDGKFDLLCEAVTHEVVHVLLDQLHEEAKKSTSPQTQPHLTDILEQATQRITRVVLEHLPKNFFR